MFSKAVQIDHGMMIMHELLNCCMLLQNLSHFLAQPNALTDLCLASMDLPLENVKF